MYNVDIYIYVQCRLQWNERKPSIGPSIRFPFDNMLGMLTIILQLSLEF